MRASALVVSTALALGVVSVASGASAQMPSADTKMMGHHTMEGQVTKVEPKSGWIDVKTAEGSMKLHFPPPALDNVKKGDRVTVDLGMRPGAPAATK
jgi:hypothetical protein